MNERTLDVLQKLFSLLFIKLLFQTSCFIMTMRDQQCFGPLLNENTTCVCVYSYTGF